MNKHNYKQQIWKQVEKGYMSEQEAMELTGTDSSGKILVRKKKFEVSGVHDKIFKPGRSSWRNPYNI